MTTERVGDGTEQVPASSEQEPKESPSTTETPPSTEATFTLEEHNSALSEALTKSREEADKVLTDAVKEAKEQVQKAKDKEIGELRKEKEQESLVRQEASEIEQWGDTPEVKTFQDERRKMATERETFQQELIANQAYAAQLNEQAKATSVSEYLSQYNLEEKDKPELLKAQSPEEMKSIAANLGYERVKAERAEKPPEKIDSSLPSSTGGNWKEQTAEDKIRGGLSQK